MEEHMPVLQLGSDASLALEVGIRGCFSESSYHLSSRVESEGLVLLLLGKDGAEPKRALLSPDRAGTLLQDIVAIMAHSESRYDIRSTTFYHARVQWSGIAYPGLASAGQSEYTASDMDSPAGIEQLKQMVQEGGALAASASELLQRPHYARAVELYQLLVSIATQLDRPPGGP